MSGALWHFFWTDTDWTGAPTPPPPNPPATPLPAPPANAGAGGGAGPDVQPTGGLDDFWDIRESYLRSLYPDPPAPPLPDPEWDAKQIEAYAERQRELNDLQSKRFEATTQLRGAADITEMKDIGGRIKSLNARIADLSSIQKVNNRYRR